MHPRILICDDEPGVRQMLEAAGYEVSIATSGREALERAVSERPGAILLDLSMPAPSGWDTALALSRSPEARDIPVVFLSCDAPADASATPVTVAGSAEKPLDARTLLAALEQALAGEHAIARVLVIEDDRDLASVLVAFFERHGMRAVHAATGAAAVELSRELQPDLLILDVGLPDGDGFWVADRLRQDERMRDIPTIVYTARELNAAERRRLDTGHTSFMTKGDVSLEEFERDVLKLVGALVPAAGPVDVGG
jgi:CheY-like chemotaxis protein